MLSHRLAVSTGLDPRRLAPGLRPEAITVPLPLDAAQLPISLTVQRRVGVSSLQENAAEGVDLDRVKLDELPVLDRKWWEISTTVQDAVGRPVKVIVTGHPGLGLPFGWDFNVWVALFVLHDQLLQRAHLDGALRVRDDGEIVGVTLGEIAVAMGIKRSDINGTIRKKIRAALRRLAHVRLTCYTPFVVDTETVAARVRADGGLGLVPEAGLRASLAGTTRAGAPTQESEQTTWLLEYDWANVEGIDREETWIRRLRVNPVFTSQVDSGWAAWVEVDVYTSLVSQYAKRLYPYFAAVAASRHASPWEYSMGQIQSILAIPRDRVGKSLGQNIKGALDELAAAGIIEQWSAKRHGRNITFTIARGPALTLAMLRRGLTARDSEDTRCLYEALRSFDMPTARAHELVTLQREAVRDALFYAHFLFETRQSQVKYSWPKAIEDRITHRREAGGNVAYQHWYRDRVTRGIPPRAVNAANPVAVVEEAPPMPSPPPVHLKDADAALVFAAVMARQPALGTLARSVIPGLVPHATRDGALVLVTEMFLTRVSEELKTVLAPLIADVSGGTLTRLEIEHYARTRHAPPDAS